ncbi:hypothetical protein UB46_14055 [Burkholderiaceae bacterium 16]|nr:hypothetical protein UB46_14055 [Burkholderiaceae bacterium 16]
MKIDQGAIVEYKRLGLVLGIATQMQSLRYSRGNHRAVAHGVRRGAAASKTGPRATQRRRPMPPEVWLAYDLLPRLSSVAS